MYITTRHARTRAHYNIVSWGTLKYNPFFSFTPLPSFLPFSFILHLELPLQRLWNSLFLAVHQRSGSILSLLCITRAVCVCVGWGVSVRARRPRAVLKVVLVQCYTRARSGDLCLFEISRLRITSNCFYYFLSFLIFCYSSIKSTTYQTKNVVYQTFTVTYLHWKNCCCCFCISVYSTLSLNRWYVYYNNIMSCTSRVHIKTQEISDKPI